VESVDNPLSILAMHLHSYHLDVALTFCRTTTNALLGEKPVVYKLLYVQRHRQNMRHFMRRIERIDIDEHATGYESAEFTDRIGEPGWNLNWDSGSRLQAQYLTQIGGKGVSNNQLVQHWLP
jgi:hypothetical protein